MYQQKGNIDNLEQQKSKYNEAVSQIIRIGNLWDSCHFHRKNGNLTKWNIDLDCVWLELSPEAQPDDYKKIKQLNDLMLNHKNFKDRVWQILMEKEMFLRKLQNRQGKGAAYLDPDEDDM